MPLAGGVIHHVHVATQLGNCGISVWWDVNLSPGDDFGFVIHEQIKASKCVIVVWSSASITSRWVYAEATLADEQNKLVPVMIGDCKIPPPFNVIHCTDLSDWKGDTQHPPWQRVINAVRLNVSDTAADIEHADSEHELDSRHSTFQDHVDSPVMQVISHGSFLMCSSDGSTEFP